MENDFTILGENVLIDISIGMIVVDIDAFKELKDAVGSIKAIYKKDLDRIRVYFSNITGSLIPLGRLILNNYNKEETIIHINDDVLDFRKENLKSVLVETAYLYRKKSKNNSSGHSNVHWHSTHKRWRVVIKGKYYGQFKTIEEAISKADRVKEELKNNIK